MVCRSPNIICSCCVFYASHSFKVKVCTILKRVGEEEEEEHFRSALFLNKLHYFIYSDCKKKKDTASIFLLCFSL